MFSFEAQGAVDWPGHLYLSQADTAANINKLMLDVSKDVDRADHIILLGKLANLGLPNFLVKWLTAFFRRKQRIKREQHCVTAGCN